MPSSTGLSNRLSNQQRTGYNNRRYDHKRNNRVYSRYNQNQQNSQNQTNKLLGSSDSLSRFSQSSAQSSPTGYDSPMRNFEVLHQAGQLPVSNLHQQLPSQQRLLLSQQPHLQHQQPAQQQQESQQPPQQQQLQPPIHQQVSPHQPQIYPQLHQKAFQPMQIPSQGFVGDPNAQFYMHHYPMMPPMGFHPPMGTVHPTYMMTPYGQQIVYFLTTPDS